MRRLACSVPAMQSAAQSRAILLFVKYPEPGRVKTRIAASVGPEKAAGIYKELVARVWSQLPADAEIVVCYDPSGRGDEVRAWLPGAARYEPQVAGDLGVRLRAAVDGAFAHGATQVAVIGSDCVELTADVFAETWEALKRSEVVLGPTTDGGYYLVALRSPVTAIFENIRWSTEHTLADTMAQAGSASVHLLQRLNDVDTYEDWLASPCSSH